MLKKITIELADFEINNLRKIGEVWGMNEGGGDSEPFDVESVAATLASNEAHKLCQEYNNSNNNNAEEIANQQQDCGIDSVYTEFDE
jgi:hypothetical protein